MDYFVWYDDTALKTSTEKINGAIAAYYARFARAPHVVLVHSTEQAAIGGTMIRAEQIVQPNTFWLEI